MSHFTNVDGILKEMRERACLEEYAADLLSGLAYEILSPHFLATKSGVGGFGHLNSSLIC